MEIMAFLIGAAARLNSSSADAVAAWPRAAQTATENGQVDKHQTPPGSWPGHWAVTKYL